jgi:hypothetical protein
MGKVLPNATFSTDKNLLTKAKYKIIEVNVWCDPSGVPCLLKFIYENENNEKVEGNDMIAQVPQHLEFFTFKMK